MGRKEIIRFYWLIVHLFMLPLTLVEAKKSEPTIHQNSYLGLAWICFY